MLDIFIAAVAVLLTWHLVTVWRKGGVPGPVELPFIHHAWQVAKNYTRFHDYLYECTVAYSTKADIKTWSVKTPIFPRFYQVNSPACVEFVLKSQFLAFDKGMLKDITHQLLGQGIFVCYLSLL